ncbi:MAG: CapA family protein [Roseovarius sp.]
METGKDDITRLREQVDVVLVSFHMGVHYIPELIADYQFEIGRAAIDCGADAVFGAHAHLPKGIEVYKGKVIFHGMHNFACRGEWVPPSKQPGSTFPESHHWDWTQHGALFKKHFGPVPDEIRRPTMIAQLTVENGAVTDVHFQPCYINDEMDPEPVGPDDDRGQFVKDYFQKISTSQGLDTRLEWDGARVRVVTG